MQALEVKIVQRTKWQRPPCKIGLFPGLALASFSIRYEKEVGVPEKTYAPITCPGIVPSFLCQRHHDPAQPQDQFVNIMTEVLVRMFMQDLKDSAHVTPQQWCHSYKCWFNTRLFETLNAAMIGGCFIRDRMPPEGFDWYNDQYNRIYNQSVKEAQLLKKDRILATARFQFETPDKIVFAKPADECERHLMCCVSPIPRPFGKTFTLFDTGAPGSSVMEYLHWTISTVRHEITEQHIIRFFEPYMPMLRTVRQYMGQSSCGLLLSDYLSLMLMDMPFPKTDREHLLCLPGH